jgi:hypothetical protein
MQQDALLLTKLHIPPIRPELVSRPPPQTGPGRALVSLLITGKGWRVR